MAARGSPRAVGDGWNLNEVFGVWSLSSPARATEGEFALIAC